MSGVWRTTQLYRWGTDLLLGAALALLLLGVGLWLEAHRPTLTGALPAADVHSVVAELGHAAPQRNHLPLKYLEAMAAADPSFAWIGSLPRPRQVLRPEDAQEVNVDLVIGPLFRKLGVPLIGRDLSSAATSLPLRLQPIREAVLSHQAAVRWFGSAEAALDQSLTVATLEWSINGTNPADFRVVGVATQEFKGTNIEQPAEIWIGINGWHDVVFPAHQVSDFRAYFAPASLMLSSEQPEAMARRVEHWLRQAGEPMARVQLIPGTGYHPQRRARFLAIAEGLVLGLGTLALLVLAALAAQSFLDVEASRQSDWTRRMLGESPWFGALRWGRIGAVGATISATTGALVTWLLLRFGATQELPVEPALQRVLHAPWLWLMLCLLFCFAVALRPVLAAALAGWRGDRELGRMIAGFFGLLALGIWLCWMSGTVATQRLWASLHLPLPERTLQAMVMRLPSEGYMWMGNRTSTDAVAFAASQAGFALASLAPDGGPVAGERVTLRHLGGDSMSVLHFIDVSPNYFDVLGIDVQWHCEAGAWPADAVWVNRRLLAMHGLAPGRLTAIVTEGGANLRVCGVVDDAQVLDARAGFAPVVYRPLRERRQLQVALSSTTDPARATRVASLLREQFPDIRPEPLRSVRAGIAEQLQQERRMVELQLALMGMSGVVGSVGALLLGLTALRRQSRALGTRRALGSPLWRLSSIALFGNSIRIWIVLVLIAGCALWLQVQVLGLRLEQIRTALSIALPAMLLWLLSMGLAIRSRISESNLLQAMRYRE